MTPKDILDSLPELIKRRAEKIYLNKEIKNITLAKGFLSSDIEDSENTHQKIRIQNGEIKSLECSCSSSSSCCHHLGALLLVAKDIDLYGPIKVKRQPKVSAKEDTNNLKSILIKASNEELIDFILSLRSIYKDVPEIIKKSFNNSLDMDYVKDKMDTIKKYANKHRKEKTQESYKNYLDKLKRIHINAKDAIKNRNYLRSTLLYLLIFDNTLINDLGIEHVVTASSYIVTASQSLETLSKRVYTQKETEQIFSYLKEIVNKNIDKTEMMVLLRAMIGYIKTEHDYDVFYELLLEAYSNMKLEPVKHKLLHLEFDLLNLFNKSNEAKELIKENPNVPYFKILTIKSLLDKGEVQKALELSIDEESKCKYDWDRLINIYYLQIRAYKALGNTDKYIDRLIKLMELGEYRAYSYIKETVNNVQWNKIYKSIKENPLINTNPKGIYQRILLEEDDKEEMIKLIEKYPHMIKEYYDFIVSENKVKATSLLKNYILEAYGRITNKETHDEVLRLLERIYIQGELKEASSISEHLINKNTKNIKLQEDIYNLKDKYASASIYRPE